MSKERIEFLISNLQEGLDVEVKNWLGGLQEKNEKSKLAKEMIALANHGGGYIFIGFEDIGEGHPEIEPRPGQAEAFTQDQISSISMKYLEPPIQCGITYHRREGSTISHPVLTIPGNHRTPVWAARSSPDQQTLQKGKVYLRRPGGASEEAKNQDDWERLLDRLVRARQSDLIDAMRDVLSPPASTEQAPFSLSDWEKECLQVWEGLIAPLDKNDARRLTTGYWTFSFVVDLDTQPSVTELNNFLERENPAYSGWRPFTYLHREPSQPRPRGDEIQAWLAQSWDAEPIQLAADHADFWRISCEGKGFSLRPHEEDGTNYPLNQQGEPGGRYFDWTLPIYRVGEFLKFVEAFGLRFADRDAKFSVLLKYRGMVDRQLQQYQHRYNVNGRGLSSIGTIETHIDGELRRIELNLEELIFALLRPVFEQFSFSQLPKLLVQNVTQGMLSYR